MIIFQILVAGGCNGWCIHNEAMSSAAIFDPDSNSWAPAAALPKPLSGARLELLDGLPTIVGGYDNDRQNDILYQVHWKPDTRHPDIRIIRK